MSSERRAGRDNAIATMIARLRSEERFGYPDTWAARDWHIECLNEFRETLRRSNGSRFAFLVSAGVGAGKTAMSVLITASTLSRKTCEKVIFVCPNRAIIDGVKKEYRAANIHLVEWNKDTHADGIPEHCDGIVLTYGAMILHAKTLSRICDQIPTLIVFDEIHHLGNKLEWGTKAREAFEYHARIIVGLSGTPYRSDNREIPFVTYNQVLENGLRTFRPDYSYTLGRAVTDGVCRRPFARWIDAEVRLKSLNQTYRLEDIKGDDDSVTPAIRSKVLKGAIHPDSASRAHILKEAVQFTRDSRGKLIIFVGGDSKRLDGGGIKDATVILPAQLQRLGVPAREICVVTGADKDARDKIKHFGKSNAWILVSVNMVSEGANIPELSVALFLTAITAKSTTIQRIGRVIRGKGEATIFMFKDARYLQYMKEIEDEVQHEVDLGKEMGRSVAAGLGGDSPKELEPSSMGLQAWNAGMTGNGREIDEAAVRMYERLAAENNWTRCNTHYDAVFSLIRMKLINDASGTKNGEAS